MKISFLTKKTFVFFSLILPFIILAGCFQEQLPPDTVDCNGSSLLSVPVSPNEKGPWPVGSRVVTIGDLKTQIWYPAEPGSEISKEKVVIDSLIMAEHVIELEGSNPDDYHKVYTDYYMDLPVDSGHGPYPAIIYVHGTAGFRTAYYEQAQHWASRGFVVLCADNPWINLTDLRRGVLNIALATQGADTEDLLAAVRSTEAPLDFLASHVDADRIGLAGHSAGGAAITGLSNEEGVRVIITMASTDAEIDSSEYLESGMVMGALEDQTVSWNSLQSGYADMNIKRKRLVGIPDTGHMGFQNFCDFILLAPGYGVDFPALFDSVMYDGCGPDYIEQEITWDIVNYATTAVFEETLTCSSTSADQMEQIQSYFEGVASSEVIYKREF